jgi:hypothetical protein
VSQQERLRTFAKNDLERPEPMPRTRSENGAPTQNGKPQRRNRGCEPEAHLASTGVNLATFEKPLDSSFWSQPRRLLYAVQRWKAKMEIPD